MLISSNNILSQVRPLGAAAKPAAAARAGAVDNVVKGEAVNETQGLGSRLAGLVKSFSQNESMADLASINKAEKAAANLKTDADFQAKTAEFKARLAKGESLESMRVEAYAVARQAAVAATGLRPYDCQVLGALAMDHGRIAEMMTGEGKTLTAIMPLYLNALAGKGAHLVTVNDTLAQRDRDTVAPIFEKLGLKTGCVLEEMTPEQKRDGYAADITYTTDRSIGFDYLRDRTARSADARVQRPLFFALVDEVDEVLLDEARTPLIISGQGQPASTDYLKIKDIVDDLTPGIDYFVDREKGAAWLSEIGLSYVENELYGKTLDFKDAGKVADYHRRAASLRNEGKALKALDDHQDSKPGFFAGLRDHSWKTADQQLKAAYEEAHARTEALPAIDEQLYSEGHGDQIAILNASLKAHALFEEGVDYLVQDNKVKIVDENKGRTSEGRRYNEGLHQALEAKSGVPIRPESHAIASITYPNLFAKYDRLAGMTGTAKSSEGEFQSLYKLDVVQVPTNNQFKQNPTNPEAAPRHNRLDQVDAIYSSKAEKFKAVVEEAVKSYEAGQPVLIGTLSVEANEYVYAKLLEAGVAPGAVQLLNAQHVRGDKTLENSIIAEAGRSGMITVATNMAGRGVDIKPDMVNYKQLAIRIEELSNAKKPIVVEVANEKEAKRLGEWLEGNFPYSIGEDTPKAGETQIRIASDKPAPEGAEVLKGTDFPTGGLYVIGTERAKSRRIDDQLIGRSGRQGQVGKSRFMLSVEDDLFRTFGGSKLQPTLALFAGDHGHIESDLVEGLVQKAQSRVGQMHFESRENMSKYDEVLNTQREAFYSMRDEIVASTDLRPLREKLIADTQDEVVERLAEALPNDGKHSAAEVSAALADINKVLFTKLQWTADRAPKKGELAEEMRGQVSQQLGRALSSFDASKVGVDELYRQSLLTTCDELWGDHIEEMGRMKDTVQWVSAAEQDPEVVYKLQAFEAFDGLLNAIRRTSVEENVSQIMVGAPVLSTERGLAAERVKAA